MAVHFGIIGLGGIAKRFAEVLGKMDDCILEAVASRDLKRSEEFAEKYKANRILATYDNLINDDNIDIIYIALTHNFHYEVIKKCLNKNKAVICEKPLVINEKDAIELAELSKEKNVLLMEAMWTRCLPTFQKAKEWIKDGKIGKIAFVDVSFAFNIPFDAEHRLYNPKLAGGSLYDAGVYPIEFAIGVLDEIPSQTNGVMSFSQTGVDDFVSMSMKFPSGALASLSCGFNANTRRDATIYGNKGHIVVYNFLGSKKCEMYNENGNLIETFEVEFEDGFIYQIQHICELYNSKKFESNMIPHKDTIACAKIFDQLIK